MIGFADEALIEVRSGNGGNGCVAFRREKYIPHGGPNGGDGGKGGDVIFTVKRNLRTLANIRHKHCFKARNGGDGQGWNRYGADGEDCVIPVPPGTTIRDAETEEIIYDFSTAKGDESFTFLKGGNGGWGNVHFKSSTNQAPKQANPGQKGETRFLKLELSIMADAGLVGFPNAGKSSLLSSLSAATPKIASYPFTTLNPIVGTVVYHDYAKIRIADVPGIIEGAAKGVGLGLAFLKHLERSRVLVYVIDMAGIDGREPWRDYEVLRREIDEYSVELAERPSVVVANKLDVEGAKENLERFVKETGVKPISISCETRDGLDALKDELRRIVNPVVKFHHTHEVAPDIKDMPDTTGDEIPAEALKFATFLKFEDPKAKSHPSRGNIH